MSTEAQKEASRRNGKLYGGMKPRTMEQLKKDFWSRVTKGPGCWIWNAAKNKDSNYGQFCWFGKVGPAHKFAYISEVGPVEEGLYVCHTCDNPPCVRPSHLFKGTALDNNRDAKSKGRSVNPPLNNPPVLTNAQAKAVARDFKPMKMTAPMLASRYNVPLHVIRGVLYGKKMWKSIQGIRPVPKRIRCPVGGWGNRKAK